MADWIKCINEDCQYFIEHGECHEVCKDQKIKKIVTNADHIRAMNDEELAEFFNKLDNICGMCSKNIGCFIVNPDRCKDNILEWLQSEAE